MYALWDLSAFESSRDRTPNQYVCFVFTLLFLLFLFALPKPSLGTHLSPRLLFLLTQFLLFHRNIYRGQIPSFWRRNSTSFLPTGLLTSKSSLKKGRHPPSGPSIDSPQLNAKLSLSISTPTSHEATSADQHPRPPPQSFSSARRQANSAFASTSAA